MTSSRTRAAVRAHDSAVAGAPAHGPSDPNDAPGPQYMSHAQIMQVIVGVMAGMLLGALDQSIVGTALPRIVSDLGGLDGLSWVVTAYLLTSTAVTPLWGKISDLYGRRLIFQIAITLFLIGSVLSGLSQNMGQLIAFRALQGIGGGGLMSIALAIIGDVISPRDRGRYQGYFGAVFGFSSVIGPLLGGWFTDTIGWRWIFYINVPIGIAALIITSTALRIPVVRREHRIDYLGASAIVASVTSLLLYLNWAGGRYGWGAPGALCFVAAAVLLAGAFIAVEMRAVEPVIPLRLFHNSIFSVGNLYSFLSGMAMFGAVIFLPVYLQAVKGMSPTVSGLAMVPAVIGVAGLSVVSGRIISQTGRYKVWPVFGAAVLILGQALLARVHVTTPYWEIGLYSFVAGAGMGMTMQAVVLAIQNSVEMRDMGAATSSAIFFRQTGAAVGTAVFGQVLSSRLTRYIASGMAGMGHAVGAGAAAAGAGASQVAANNIQAIQALPEPIKHIVLTAFSHAIDDVFLVGVPFVAIGFFVALLLREIPLRTAGPGGSSPVLE